MIWPLNPKSNRRPAAEQPAPSRPAAERRSSPCFRACGATARRNGPAALVRENVVTVDDLIWPIFVCEGVNLRQPIASMPGVERLSSTRRCARREARPARHSGASRCFPIPTRRCATRAAAKRIIPDNLICRAVRAIRETTPGIGLITDVALDPYTSHGHDGLLSGEEILNDETVAALVKQALNQARAGADIIAPSDMMDGRVRAIRAALDAEGFSGADHRLCGEICLGLLRPFRDAVGSSKTLAGDKRTYQMDPANSDEALREVAQDIEEGADIVMVKPGLPYLDIICAREGRVRPADLRLSGVGRIRDDRGRRRQWLARRRQGHDGEPSRLQTRRRRRVLTYYAPRAAKLLRGG